MNLNPNDISSDDSDQLDAEMRQLGFVIIASGIGFILFCILIFGIAINFLKG